MTEDEILKLWRKAIKPGDRIRHIAAWEPGTVIGKSAHPIFELDVDFGPGVLGGQSHVHLKNLYPEWWPAPDWARAHN